MPLNWPKTGAQYSTAFVVSGVPWVSGSIAVGAGATVKVELPNVSRDFTVSNTGGNEVRFGFTQNGVSGSNFFTVAAGEEKNAEIRIRDLYLFSVAGSTVDVLAGLTSISRNDFPNITGSNPAPTGSQYLPGIG